jgi:sugar phosphate isomerase/epimerase
MAMRAFSTLGCSGATLPEVITLAAESGCTGVELRSAIDEVVHTGLADDHRAAMREELAAAELHVLTVASYVRICGQEDVDADLAAHLKLAVDLGADGVRVFPGDPDREGSGELTPGEQLALDRLEPGAALARELGVSIFVELHDSHSAGARLARLMAAVDERLGDDHPVRVIWDAAHSWRAGESPAESVELLRPWIAYVQVKDTDSRDGFRPVFPGTGDYPVASLVDVLDPAWAQSLEWERKWHPELPPLAEALPATWEWLDAAR